MTAVDNITSLRQRREAIVNQHAEAENRHDIESQRRVLSLRARHFRCKLRGDPELMASDSLWAVTALSFVLMALCVFALRHS